MLHLQFALLFVLFIFRSFPRGMWCPEVPEMLYIVKFKRHTMLYIVKFKSLCPLSIVFRGNPCKMNICGDPSGVKTKYRGRTACEVQSLPCLTGCWKQGVHGGVELGSFVTLISRAAPNFESLCSPREENGRTQIGDSDSSILWEFTASILSVQGPRWRLPGAKNKYFSPSLDIYVYNWFKMKHFTFEIYHSIR